MTLKNLYVKLILCLIFIHNNRLFGQFWSSEELGRANTAISIQELTFEEKDAIKYINLARMYPQKFAKLEVETYLGPVKYGDYLRRSAYKQSLLSELNKISPSDPIYFSKEMQILASCFARESGINGIVGHNRISCTDGYDGECCSYGPSSGKDIALQLLIDHNVPSLGHRKICLDDKYLFIGVSIMPHTQYENCTVLNFKIGSKTSLNQLNKKSFTASRSETVKEKTFENKITYNENLSELSNKKNNRIFFRTGIGVSLFTNNNLIVISPNLKKIPLHINGLLGWHFKNNNNRLGFAIYGGRFIFCNIDSTLNSPTYSLQNRSLTEIEGGFFAMNTFRLSAGVLMKGNFLSYRTLSGGISIGNRKCKIDITNSFYLDKSISIKVVRFALTLTYCLF